MDIKEMRQMPPEALRSEVEKAREKLWKLRFKAKGEPLENPGEVRMLKKEIARMLTVLREKELARNPRPRKLTRAERKALRARERAQSARAGGDEA